MDQIVGIAARIGVVGVALTGGALFAFSAFVMAALRRVPDDEGARAMQQINITVFTPWFMVPFFGSAVLSGAAVVVGLLHTDRDWWMPLVGAGLMYGLGLFGITVVGNVPLNNKLAGMDAEDEEARAFWRRYLVVWTRWNHVRVAASVGAMLLFAETVRLAGAMSVG